MEDGEQHHGRLEQQVEPAREVADPEHGSSMEASEDAQNLQRDAQLCEKGGWVVHDLGDVGNASHVNGPFSGKVPLMCVPAP